MQLSGIFVYPIKGCAGVSLAYAEVASRGLARDRRYMLVDRHGVFVTQREAPRLCLVSTAIFDSSIEASSPGSAKLVVPRSLDASAYERRPYRVWGDHGHALLHPTGSRWFSELLGEEVSLLYMPDDERRPVNPKRARPGDIVSFADAYPLLLVSEASLSDLNQRLEAPVDMRRFRPNLVVSACEPYAEDRLCTLRIGDVSFRAVKRCERCVVTTVDPDSAQRGPEPLRTLASYRGADGKIWFGMNLIHDGEGTLRVGDAVYGQ